MRAGLALGQGAAPSEPLVALKDELCMLGGEVALTSELVLIFLWTPLGRTRLELGWLRPNLALFLPTLRDFGRIWPDFGQKWPQLGKLGRFRPKLVGQIWRDTGQTKAVLAEFGPSSG